MQGAQPHVAGIVTRTGQKKLVESHGDLVDKRVKNVKLTEKGYLCCEDAHHHMVESEQKILAALTEEEQTMFRVLLQKVIDSLNESNR